MKTLLLVLLFLIASMSGNAQNWQTVRRLDTNYYNGGPIMPYSAVLDTNLLRVMWVDSSGVSGGDSVFYLYRAIRIDTPYFNSSKCRDTSAPSWLGSKMIRKAGGTELYFNMRGDTITVQTNAGLGTSWALVKDASGIIYKGTVSSTSTATIDGVIDSIKTISIQAMNGSTAIADPYNSLVLQLSKQHGWIKTLDLYRFPYKTDLGVFNILGIVRDSLQHQRLPKRFSTCFQKDVNLAWRYAPGNEWITVYSSGVAPWPSTDRGMDSILTYDSVISASMISPSRVSVTLLTQKDSLVKSHWPPFFSSSTFMHTDTITAGPVAPPDYPFSVFEAKTDPIQYWGIGGPFTRYRMRYFVDTVSNGNLSIERIEGEDGLDLYPNAGCWQIVPGLGDRFGWVANYVEDFGQRLKGEYGEQAGVPLLYYRNEIVYANVSGMRWGNKMRLSKLGVGETLQASSFRVQPNPADGYVTVASPFVQQVLQVRMMSVSGQEYYRRSFTGGSFVVPTKDLVAGMYFLEVSGKGGRQTFKVVVRH